MSEEGWAHPAAPEDVSLVLECRLTIDKSEVDVPEWAEDYEIGDVIHGETGAGIVSLPVLGWSMTERNRGCPVVEERPVAEFNDMEPMSPGTAATEDTVVDVRLEEVSEDA